jgi:hypothetical protein
MPGRWRRAPRDQSGVEVSSKELSGLLQFTGQETDSGLTRLETANNWTLTVSLAAVITIVNTGSFPSDKSLMLLCATILLTSHFTVRAMKGYINVIRFSALNHAVVGLMLIPEAQRTARFSEVREKFQEYNQEWRLPIKRHHVWVKTLTEFSFGYIFAGLAGLVAYNASVVVTTPQVRVVCIIIIGLAVAELANFHFRSPYMRPGRIDEAMVRTR